MQMREPAMPSVYHFSLKRSLTVMEDGPDLLIADTDARALRVHSPGPAVRAMLERLAADGGSAEDLCGAGAGDDAEGEACSSILGAIGTRAFLRSTLVAEGRRLATLEPLSRSFQFADVELDGSFRLSRFAWLRRVDGETVLETSLGHARLVLHDGRLAALAGLLAEPCTVTELADGIAGVDAEVAEYLMRLLVNTDAVCPCDADGRIDEDHNITLRQWDFHDLLFHSRSRVGRHAEPSGVHLRFMDDIEPLPAVKLPMSKRRISLFKPDLEALAENDVPFSRVSEGRRSVREFGERPLTLDQLGEFLYRSARVVTFLPPHPEKGLHWEASLRPCCAGGAIHSLELYLAVNRVEGLEPGFYRYNPLSHELEHLGEPSDASRRLLVESRWAMGLDAPGDVLITMASRLPRLSWKYQSIAYALVLKDVGALMQQMYLVATAQGLAPCAIGTGNSETFAAASGLDYCIESPVGEFVLSSRRES